MQDTADVKTFDIVFEGKARSSGKLRCDIDVEFVTTKEKFSLATDEGTIHGGDNSAPPPLALFTGALTACLMTQIRAFAKRLRIPVANVEIFASLRWRSEQVGKQPYVGEPVGFDLDIEIDSEASLDDVKRLIDAARKGCFLEATLGQANEIRHRLKVGDGWISI